MKTTISELLGWKKQPTVDGHVEWASPSSGHTITLLAGGEPVSSTPFRALWEVWDAFTDEEHDAFRVALREIILRDGPIGQRPPSMTWATEEQRTEALLRVKNR